jgi:hypothetical protein
MMNLSSVEPDLLAVRMNTGESFGLEIIGMIAVWQSFQDMNSCPNWIGSVPVANRENHAERLAVSDERRSDGRICQVGGGCGS